MYQFFGLLDLDLDRCAGEQLELWGSVVMTVVGFLFAVSTALLAPALAFEFRPFWHLKFALLLVPGVLGAVWSLLTIRHLNFPHDHDHTATSISFPLVCLEKKDFICAIFFSILGLITPGVFFPLSIILRVEGQISLANRIEEIEGGLHARLLDGTIRLLRVSWLLDQPQDWTITRRQELPEAAFVSGTQAVELVRQGRVAALSYRSVPPLLVHMHIHEHAYIRLLTRLPHMAHTYAHT